MVLIPFFLLPSFTFAADLALYWGQASAGFQDSLGSYCESSPGDIYIISFVNQFGSGRETSLNVDGSSGPISSLSIPSIGSDIEKCQQLGKKILLSLGGAIGNYGFSSDADAVSVANELWNAFGGGSGVNRPFGSAKVDGFDLDIENMVAAEEYIPFVNQLRALYAADTSKSYYVGAAPQCPYPDASSGKAIAGADLDYLFIQFYNNYCNLDGSYFNYDTWQEFASYTSPNPNVKLFVGLAGSSSAAGSGYVTVDQVKEKFSQFSNSANFGGFMVWDASQANSNIINGESFAQQLSALAQSSNNNNKAVHTSSSSSVSSTTTTTSETPAAETSQVWWTPETPKTTTSSSSSSTSSTSSSKTTSTTSTTQVWWTPETPKSTSTTTSSSSSTSTSSTTSSTTTETKPSTTATPEATSEVTTIVTSQPSPQKTTSPEVQTTTSESSFLKSSSTSETSTSEAITPETSTSVKLITLVTTSVTTSEPAAASSTTSEAVVTPVSTVSAKVTTSESVPTSTSTAYLKESTSSPQTTSYEEPATPQTTTSEEFPTTTSQKATSTTSSTEYISDSATPEAQPSTFSSTSTSTTVEVVPEATTSAPQATVTTSPTTWISPSPTGTTVTAPAVATGFYEITSDGAIYLYETTYNTVYTTVWD